MAHDCITSLDGNPNGWAPADAAPANGGWDSSDGNAGSSPDSGSWDTSGWTDDQTPDSGDAQAGWTADNATPDDGTSGSWDNNAQGVWNSQGDNSAGWTNPPSQVPPTNGQGQNVWIPQGNVQGGGVWNGNPPQQGGNGGGWIQPQQGPGWAPQSQGGGTRGGANVGWNANGGSWTNPPASTTVNTWNNGAPTVTSNVGWNNGQQGSGGWSNANTGSAGWQDGDLSWKVYNEDTKTMENLDDTSGWKVVGDGGPDGWKLVDENGNIEWKIENINGEWKVTSADEFSQTNNTSITIPIDSVNATSDATNDTSIESTTTTPVPGGGWDDDKQGRYIVWKFSEDGKGEARVYGGGGTEPEVWTVGDNNQWWKETMGVKEADTVVQAGWNPASNSWQGNGWQNTASQADNSWQSDGNINAPQNGGWQNAGGSPGTGVVWQQNPTSQNGGVKWQNKRPLSQNTGNSWQTGGSAAQRAGNRWQQQGGTTAQKKWKNGAPSGQPANSWQNQAPTGWNARNIAPTTNGWRNAGTNSQSNGGQWQNRKAPQNTAWQNRPPPNSGRWSNNGQGGGVRKGRWRNNGNRPPGRWTSNNVNSARKNKPVSGRAFNSDSDWRTASGVQGQGNGAWTNTGVTPPPSPPPANSGSPENGGQVSYANDANNVGWARSNGGGGQTVPYIIIIKAPDSAGNEGNPNAWANAPNGGTTTKKPTNSNGGAIKPSRRSNGWKMNRAGSSGWQWNPQGGSEGWQWRDGWMGSGGGFGGWMNDKGAMYSNWKPTKSGTAQSRKFATQRADGAKGNKKSASKMVFVFGTKKNSGNLLQQPTNKVSKKGKQVIIIDYTTGAKKIPKGEEGMKQDIESVIQAIKTAKPTGIRGSSVRRQTGQKRVQSQKWSR